MLSHLQPREKLFENNSYIVANNGDLWMRNFKLRAVGEAAQMYKSTPDKYRVPHERTWCSQKGTYSKFYSKKRRKTPVCVREQCECAALRFKGVWGNEQRKIGINISINLFRPPLWYHILNLPLPGTDPPRHTEQPAAENTTILLSKSSIWTRERWTEETSRTQHSRLKFISLAVRKAQLNYRGMVPISVSPRKQKNNANLDAGAGDHSPERPWSGIPTWRAAQPFPGSARRGQRNLLLQETPFDRHERAPRSCPPRHVSTAWEETAVRSRRPSNASRSKFNGKFFFLKKNLCSSPVNKSLLNYIIIHKITTADPKP